MTSFFKTSEARPPDEPLRLPYGDSMRVLATLAVILNHAVIPLSFRSVESDLTDREVLYCLGATCTRWCVPIFFMLSGALLLDPLRIESTAQFYRRRIWRVGIPTAAWTVFYLVESHWARGLSLQPTTLAKAVLAGRPAYHLWFVYSLLCLYLVTPTVKSVFLKATLSEQWQLAGGMIVLAATAAIRWTAEGTMGWQIPPDSTFVIEWVFYLGYFLAGYLLRSITLTRSGLWVGWIVSLILGGLSSFGYWTAVRYGEAFRGQGLFMSYLSPINVFFSLIAFLLMATHCRGVLSQSRIVQAIGAASFGAYLVHVSVLDLIWFALRKQAAEITGTAAVPVWFVTAILSFAFGLAALRIPRIRVLVGG